MLTYCVHCSIRVSLILLLFTRSILNTENFHDATKLDSLVLSIITVSIILFSFALFVMFIEPSRLVDPVPIDPVVWSTVQPNVPQHCLDMINKRSQKSSRVFAQVAPPWVDLVENVGNATVETTMAKMQQLYVHVFAAHTRRLGNQLFNYASLFGVAWRHRDRIPLWPNRKTQLRSVFNLRIPIDRNDTVIGNRDSKFMKLREPGWAIYGPKTEHLPERNVSLTVFLQSWRYFIHVEDQLRVDFTFKQHVIDKARRFLNSKIPEEWRDLDFVRVAIHARRGDYVNKGLQSFGWTLPEPDYFNRSMAYFAGCLPRIQFVVLSNDMKWCRRNIFGPNVVYSGGRNPTEDMAIASLCDHAIISIGSYGWWAAWFANGVTVTQKNFPTPNSKLLKKLSRSDYYKPDWIAL